jgi:redox-sensitive bicupin YhaK (pirin superfamily)
MDEGIAGAGSTASSCGRNLPANLKMTDPRYQDIPASAIPEITDDDETRVTVICREFWRKSVYLRSLSH